MKNIYLICLCLLSLTLSCIAEPAKQETVEKMLEVTQAQKMTEAVYAQLDGIFNQALAGQKNTDDKKPIIEKFLKKHNALVREEISWVKIKPSITEAYKNIFTEEEIRDLIKFYESPTGKKLLIKTPEIMTASMKEVQKSMEILMPKLQSLQSEMTRELQNSLESKK